MTSFGQYPIFDISLDRQYPILLNFPDHAHMIDASKSLVIDRK